ncbi:unnamed protein product [Sphagnum jensenii]|uniref:Uncharacterized protein n=1 Tax=Sphagnum jensenii TaxID=128206 RepID=A0ABP1BB48_9BRYO
MGMVPSKDFPPCKVRRAITDEADNLVPLIERGQKRGLPLTDLPPSSHPDHPHAVARLISAQNKRDAVFTAEVEHKVVGLMSITGKVDMESLNRNFELDLFDNLVSKGHHPKKKSKEVTEVLKASIPVTIPENVDAAEAEENAVTVPPPSIPEARPSTKLVSPSPRDAMASPAHEAQSSAKISTPASRVSKAVPKASTMSSKDAKEVQIVKEQKLVSPTQISNNLFQVTMLILDEGYGNHYIDFLLAAFKQQEMDYCMVALPYASAFHPMLHLFTRVISRSNPDLQWRDDDPFSSNKTSIYLLHRNGLSPGFEVRRSKSIDAVGLAELLEAFPDQSAIVDLVLKPYKGCVTTVALMGLQIVGFAWLEDGVPLETLHTHFEIDALVPRRYHPQQQHAVLLLYVLSPIFHARSRLFLRETMRLMMKTVLYCPIFPRQELPERLLEDFLLVCGKQQLSVLPSCSWGHVVDPPSKLDSASSVDQCGQLRGQFIGFECTLYLTSKKFVCRHKAVINSRIVVIGASRAASSFLQTLMLSTSMWFMNLTLISANRFEGHNQHAAAAPIKGSSRRGSSSNSKLTPLNNPLEFDPGPSESFWKLGLDCAVKLIIGVVGGIDRNKKTVSLLTKEINNEVTYDWLVLATGLQDQTRHALGLCTLTHGLKGVIRAQELAADHCIANTAAYAKSYIGSVVVYGSTLEAFCAVQILLGKGKKGSDLFLIHPETEALENFESSCLKDTNVAREVVGSLKAQGVQLIHSKKLVAIHLNAMWDWVDSLTFTPVLKTMDPKNIARSGHRSSGDKRGVHVHFSVNASKDLEAVEEHLSQVQELHPLTQAPNSTGVIYDGRVIVDGFFQTNDNSIFATGSVAKFSRKCSKHLPKLDKFCSKEAGKALAETMFNLVTIHSPTNGKVICPWEVLKKAPPQGNSPASVLQPTIEHVQWPRPFMPLLYKPKVVGGILPGNMHFLSVTLPSLWLVTDLRTVKTLKTNDAGKYCRVDVLQSGEVAQFIYLGSAQVETWKISTMVGLQESTCSELLQR